MQTLKRVRASVEIIATAESGYEGRAVYGIAFIGHGFYKSIEIEAYINHGLPTAVFILGRWRIEFFDVNIIRKL